MFNIYVRRHPSCPTNHWIIFLFSDIAFILGMDSPFFLLELTINVFVGYYGENRIVTRLKLFSTSVHSFLWTFDISGFQMLSIVWVLSFKLREICERKYSRMKLTKQFKRYSWKTFHRYNEYFLLLLLIKKLFKIHTACFLLHGSDLNSLKSIRNLLWYKVICNETKNIRM